MKKKEEKTFTSSEIITTLYDTLTEELNNIVKNSNVSDDMKFTTDLFKMSIIASVMVKLKEEK